MGFLHQLRWRKIPLHHILLGAIALSSLFSILMFFSLLYSYINRQDRFSQISHELRSGTKKKTPTPSSSANLSKWINKMRDLPLLYNECYLLSALDEQGKLTPDKKNRCCFLQTGKNALSFSPSTSSPGHKSRWISLHIPHPVEADGEDIQKMIAHISGIWIGNFHPFPERPLLFVKYWEMVRTEKEQPLFSIDIQLSCKESPE